MEQQQQYQNQSPMQPMHQPMPSQQVQGGEWQNNLCNCSPCESCVLGTFVPCLLVGKTADRMRDPTMQTSDLLNSDCLIHGALTWFTGCGWIYAMMKRTEIRDRFQIPGSAVGDCCTSYWCPCCAVIQQDNEVKSRLPVAGAAIDNQYQAQPPMGMPSPPAQAAQHHSSKEGGATTPGVGQYQPQQGYQ
ncbi:PLAC8-domain-containing protein [Apiospora phragmitis]|uniref:PLAC8-domain-containing protein n=1 Tax=Apiospora phragmitis TaxID=2905665 RepID=A0ABR1V2L2_9PEZI